MPLLQTVEKYAAEQAEHEGISAVIKEVESQPGVFHE